MRTDSKITKISKDKFEKVYRNNTLKETAAKLGISKASVSNLARIYDVRKNNTMR